jgi:TM2 domain-containing membrane protein YozV
MSNPNPNLPPPPPYPYPSQPPHLADAHSKKMLAGILGIFLGNFGIHKFVLGYTTAGIITLVISLTCIGAFPMRIIAFIEAIMYLTKTDEDFYNIYIRNKKEWF